MSNSIKNITVTIIFEASALNRDDKIGGNILSIKKLNVNGEVKSFLSKPAIRHYLFETLNRVYPKDWKPASVISKEKNVIQFDLTNDDILSSAELDAFGFMYTISGEKSITRKSPVGIIKAISLKPYNQDMAFYANHDLSNRLKQSGFKSNPNPYNKKENLSLFKLTFTVDSKILGEDIWYSESEPVFDDTQNILKIEIAKPVKVMFEAEKSIDEEGTEYFKVKNDKIYVDLNRLIISSNMIERKKDKKTDQEYIQFKSSYLLNNDEESEQLPKKRKGKKKSNILVYDFSFDEERDVYEFYVTRIPQYDEDKQILTIQTGAVKYLQVKSKISSNEYEVDNGKIIIKPLENVFEIQFQLDINEKSKRILQILETIKDGLYAQSSGEANTTIPLFMIAAAVKIPSPIFHPFIDVKSDDDGLKVIGIKDAMDNSWLEDNCKIFIKDCERLKTDFTSDKITNDWNSFLNAVGLGSNS